MRIVQLTALTALFALTGCVSSGRYETLEKQYGAEQAKSKTLEEKVAQLEAEVASLNQRIEELNAEKAAMSGNQAALEGSITDMQRALAELEARKRAAEARVAEFRRLVERFKPLVDAGRLRVKIVEGRMVVELATDILFGSGSADLSPEGKTAIAEVATLLTTIPDRNFQVEGHTDNVPIGNARFPSNWELAAARSITVVKTMIEAGMPPARVSGASYGEFKPAAPNDTKENKGKNRRIEIVVVPDLSELPGFDELNRIETGS